MPKKWKPSVTWAKKAKKACEKTIAEYKEYGLSCLGLPGGDDLCPLCQNFREDKLSLGLKCNKCPWVVFNKRANDTGDACLVHDFLDDPLPKRLARLRGWIKRCDNIIEKGAKK